MIEKPRHLQDDSGGMLPWEGSNSHRPVHPGTPGNNGLRRVDSEGSPFAAGAKFKGLPPRAVSTDHVPILRQGGGGFTDLFEGTNVQETFV